MAKPTTRKEFKEYCLKKLGHPVIQINVSDEQIEDRIDEAVSFYNDYHYNGAQHLYLKHLITEEDIENGYITVPERLIGVVRIFDLSSSISSGTGMFNVTYQFVLNNLQSLTGYSIQNYYMTMQNLRMIQEFLVGWPMIRYNRNVNRVYLDLNMRKLVPGKYIIVEAYDPVNGEDYPDVWNERWLQNYTTALIKEQWGSNLTKFNNMQLVGGIQFNGQNILADAIAEKHKLEQEAYDMQPLVYNFSG
jgi:hypothetical protein